MNRPASEWVAFGLRLAVGLALFVSGALKIDELTTSVRAVKAYRLFSPEVAEFIGYVQPPLLMIVGTLLILGLFTRIAAVIAALVMVAFIIGIASVWVRGLNIDCGCFSSGGDREGAINYYEYAREIFRDLILLGAAAWLAVSPRSAWSLDSLRHPQPVVDDDPMADDVSPGDGDQPLTSAHR